MEAVKLRSELADLRVQHSQAMTDNHHRSNQSKEMIMEEHDQELRGLENSILQERMRQKIKLRKRLRAKRQGSARPDVSYALSLINNPKALALKLSAVNTSLGLGNEEKRVRGAAGAQAVTVDEAKKALAATMMGGEVARDSLDGLATVEEGGAAEEGGGGGGDDDAEAAETATAQMEATADKAATDQAADAAAEAAKAKAQAKAKAKATAEVAAVEFAVAEAGEDGVVDLAAISGGATAAATQQSSPHPATKITEI